MGKLIFRYTDKEYIEVNREASEIELTVPDDMDINEFKVICVRLASSMGFSDKSIVKSFYDLIYGDENVNNKKELLDELNIKSINKKS